jgi:outer membrane receptor for ferrienterochelin and colicin
MINRKRVRLSKLSLGLAIALAAAPAFAQQTSAGLAGQISGADGQPVSGATVTIVHSESGTVSNTVTDASGHYVARGLRVGGPYTVTVTKDGQTTTREGVYLDLGETSNLDAQLASAVELGAVTVVGGSTVINPTQMGAVTDISRAQLQALPSIQRNLQDYARLDPRLSQSDKTRGEISMAGTNSRYNTVTIDGVSTSDTFGLESNNLPTERQPISIDAIESVQVNISNYDVTQTRYLGANINAVTKSGTNDFHGSVTAIGRDNDMVGDLNGADFTAWDSERTYGATFGGPLIRDRLFFFLSYEKFKRTGPGSSNGPVGSGSSIIANGVTQAEIDEIIDIAQTRYGIDAGSLVPPTDATTDSEDKLVKLDWNINDAHRLSLRLNETEQSVSIFPNATSTSRISLSTQQYDQVKNFQSQVAQLYSDWTDNFSTEFKVSHRDYESVPLVNALLPQVAIGSFDPLSADPAAGGTVFFGTEQFRHANVLETETWNYFGAANWYLGDHEVKFGFDYEDNDVYNLFVESSLGVFHFANIEAFRQGQFSANSNLSIFNGYTLRAAAPGANPAAEFTLRNLGLFGQDTWRATDNLTLAFGIRYDEPSVPDSPRANACVAQAPGVAATNCPNGGFGLDNTTTIDGNGLFQPRFGFNYTFDSDRAAQLRGGFGLFQGAAANVWLGNPYTNNGQTIQVFTINNGDIDNFGGDLQNVTLPPGTLPTQDVDILAEGLKQPSAWKANLAFDTEFDILGGIVATAEFIFTNVEDAFAYEHLNLGAPVLGLSNLAGTTSVTSPDGRNLYWGSIDNAGIFATPRARRNPTFNDVLLTRQTDKGAGKNISFSITKPKRDTDWFWQVGYSYTDASEVSPLTSSRAISNWRNTAAFNPNDGELGDSGYEIKDRFTGALIWNHAFFGEYKTEVGLFFEGRSGKPYSWTYANDANGDGISGNDLMYIPSGPDDVVFTGPTATADELAFWDFVDSHPELERSKGGVVGRNDSRAPWVNTFDLRLSQEIPGFFKGNKAQVWVDILNVGNMIKDSFGHADEFIFDDGRGGYVRNFATLRGIDPATGKYIFGSSFQEDFTPRDLPSRWSVQVGFTYKF